MSAQAIPTPATEGSAWPKRRPIPAQLDIIADDLEQHPAARSCDIVLLAAIVALRMAADELRTAALVGTA